MVKRMDKLKIFENAEFGQTRTITIDNESWFCGKDVASSLGYVNTKKALLDHCKEPWVTICDLGYRRISTNFTKSKEAAVGYVFVFQ
jgi:hypothetical protein